MQGRHYPPQAQGLFSDSFSSVKVKPRGFTLIEILVTVVLISIVLGIALLKFRGSDYDALLKQEAGRMARIMELADQQAIYQSLTIGMLLEDNSYSLLQYNIKEVKDDAGKTVKENQWEPVDDALLKPRELPEGMEMLVTIEGNPADLRPQSDKPIPQIVFLNSGEWTAFEIIFTLRENNDTTYILSTNENGKLEITRESNQLQ